MNQFFSLFSAGFGQAIKENQKKLKSLYEIGYAEEEGETTYPQDSSFESDSDNEATTMHSVPVYITAKSTGTTDKEAYEIASYEEENEKVTQKSDGYDNESNTRNVKETTKQKSQSTSLDITDKAVDTKQPPTSTEKYVFVICLS
jgi:hypothetical protein